MLIPTQTNLALRCPNCGKLGFYTISRFALSKGKQGRFTCDCGACLATMGYKGRESICLQVECALCERRHILTYKTSRLWKNEIKTIVCEETELETGFIGPRDQVREYVQRMDRSIREMAEELGYDKYFINPDIMYQVLDALRRMTENGRVSCSCGTNNLEVEVHPDRIELYCSDCDAVGIVIAETEEDLHWVNNIEELTLEANKYRHFNAKRSNKRGRSTRRNT